MPVSRSQDAIARLQHEQAGCSSEYRPWWRRRDPDRGSTIMINEIKKDAQTRMQKSLESLTHAFTRIRTGKAHPSILGGVMVPYYGADTPLSQVANVTVKDSRTLQVVAFERNMLAAVDKAIQSSGLGFNPTNLGELLLISMPA
ncbi:Ribosome-recycling factor, partial [Pseudomonas syringae pv. coryli]